MKLLNCIKRYIALLTDFIIIGIFIFIIIFVTIGIPTLIADVNEFTELFSDVALILIIQITGFTLFSFYFIVLETRYNATLGKMALGIRLRAENGEKIEMSRIIIRYLLFLTTGVTVIGFVFYLFNRRDQFLHDWLTKILVE